MTWDEFSDLLNGLNESTPLVRVAQIRTETKPEALREFTPSQLRMRSEWQREQAKRKSREEVDNAISTMQRAFEAMWGQDGNQ